MAATGYCEEMIDPEKVRAAVRRLRTDKRWTADELSDQSGVNRATIYRLEKAGSRWTNDAPAR